MRCKAPPRCRAAWSSSRGGGRRWWRIGRLSAEKGFAGLIEAFGRANRAHGDTHQLLIVGEGPERAALAQRIAALGLHERVTLAGYVAGADRLLETAAGFVMSSLTEGMPLVLMEALQWGVPILATAVGAIPELLQDGRCGRAGAARTTSMHSRAGSPLSWRARRRGSG